MSRKTIDRDKILKQYLDLKDKLPLKEMVKQMGISINTLYNALRDLGIRSRKKCIRKSNPTEPIVEPFNAKEYFQSACKTAADAIKAKHRINCMNSGSVG